MVDVTGTLRDYRDSIQQTVYDLNFLYENWSDTPESEEELERIVADLRYDANKLEAL